MAATRTTAGMMGAAGSEGRQLDRASVAFLLGVCAGVRSRPAEAEGGLLAVGGGIQLWSRCWGNRAGTPVVFVHGEPGNYVADCRDINVKFFGHIHPGSSSGERGNRAAHDD